MDSDKFTTEPGSIAPQTAFRSQRLKLMLAAVVLAMALGYFTFTAFQSARVYYLTVGEVLTQTSNGELLRANGKLVPNSFQRDTGETKATFTLTDGTATLSVNYDGVVSDLFFNPEAEIVAEGIYHGQGTFDATDILVKCPSKYVAAEGS